MDAPSQRKLEIDHHTAKLIVGVIAVSLPFLVSLFSSNELTSISASYYQSDWSRNIFVGFLFAICAFLLAYNGHSTTEMLLSKIAGVSAVGVAMFPCDCKLGGEQLIPYVHYLSAATLFMVLTYFCYGFYQRARKKGHAQAIFRSKIYGLCGVILAVASVFMLLDALLGERLSDNIAQLVFFCESAGLVAFGVAWLTASLTLPVVTTKTERHRVLKSNAATPD